MSKPNLASNLLFGLVMGLPFGFIGASIFVTFHDGFSQAKLDTMDPFAFWNETPFHPGYSPGLWYMGLKIIGGVAAAAMALALAMSFNRTVSHNGTAQWAEPKHMATLGYLQRYRKITGPIFGKSGSPRSHGKFLTSADQPHSLVVAPTRAGR